MKVPLERTFRGLTDREAAEALAVIEEQVDRLETFHGDIIAVRVAVEHPQQAQRAGSRYRVRVQLTLPGAPELVVVKEPGDMHLHDSVALVTKTAFHALERRLREVLDQRRGHVPRHVEPIAFVVRLFREEGYGFIKTPEGRDIYFHRNSVVNNNWDRVEVGTQVRYVTSDGEQGPQASTVDILDKPGVRATPRGDERVGVPPGWRQRRPPPTAET